MPITKAGFRQTQQPANANTKAGLADTAAQWLPMKKPHCQHKSWPLQTQQLLKLMKNTHTNTETTATS